MVEDSKVKEEVEEMKRYKLKKDLPTFKAGRTFILDNGGNLYLQKETPPNFEGDIYEVMAYSRRTIEKFPNILTDWFEEIPEEPKTVWDLKEGDKYWGIGLSELTGFRIGEHEFGLRAVHYREVGDVFLTKEDAEASIKAHEKEWKIYLGVEE